MTSVTDEEIQEARVWLRSFSGNCETLNEAHLTTALGDVLAKLDETQEVKEIEVGWLIEKMLNGNIHYITVDLSLTWTDDPLKALRLARREDANMLCEIIEDADKVTEHQFG